MCRRGALAGEAREVRERKSWEEPKLFTLRSAFRTVSASPRVAGIGNYEAVLRTRNREGKDTEPPAPHFSVYATTSEARRPAAQHGERLEQRGRRNSPFPAGPL